MNSQSTGKSLIEDVKKLLASVLGPELESADVTGSTLLLGERPELDSIAVVNLILAMEKQFGFEVADDDIDATSFESVGSLEQYIDARLGR